MKIRTRTLAALLLTVSVVAPVQAGQEGELADLPSGQVAGLPIDQLPPGARALGLGGAFTAVADDATAALANPAGLTNLSAPEVSLFIRNTSADVNFLDVDAFGSGLNALSGQTNKTYSDDSTDISFASFVVPFERFVLSAFYSNQLNFRSAQDRPDVYFDDILGRFAKDPETGEILYPFESYLDQYTNTNSVDGTLAGYGLSGAFRVTDRFSVGVTLRKARLELRNEDAFRLDWWNDIEWYTAIFAAGEDAGVADALRAQSVVNDFYTYGVLLDGKSTDTAIDVGLYYKGDQWSFGFTYHDGAKFGFDTVGSLESAFSCNPGGDPDMVTFCETLLAEYEAQDLYDEAWPNELEPGRADIRLPRILSFGVSWRPTNTWLISFDANHNEYSRLSPLRSELLGFEFAPGVPLDINNPDQRAVYNDPAVRAIQGPVTEDFSDEMTYHLGVEKAFVFDSGVLRSLALRGGAFTIADHDGVVAYDSDETVWTIGLGTTWGKNELGAKVFQVDLGASFADDVTNVVLSGILRF